jgi:Phosphate-selective porin O and P
MVLSKCTGGRLGCIMPSGDGASGVVDGARPLRGRGAVLSSLLGAVSTVALGAGAALAADDAAPRSTGEQAAVQALMAKIESMEQRINGLQAELKLAKASGSRASTMAQSVSPGSRLPADAKPFKEAKADGSKASNMAQSASAADDAKPFAELWDNADGSKASSAAPSAPPASRLPANAASYADTKSADAQTKFLLAADLKTPPPPANGKDLFGTGAAPVPALKIGMYGEIKFQSAQNPNAGGQWQNGFDMGRLVLLPTYQVTDNIVFNAEIEFEHSGTGFDKDDKLHGTAEIEQAFFDFRFNDSFTLRSPGVDLVPISFNNMYHEPTLFYSVDRPELANGLIPSTWVAPSAGFYGKIVDGLNYQFQISQSAEDFGDDFAHRGVNGAPIPGGYAAGVDGANALAFAHAPLGGFTQMSNTPAFAFRLSYQPGFIPGFAGSSAVYYSPNVTPRGAYGDDGRALGTNAMTIFDTEFRYRVPNTGLELRAEYAYINFSNPENLRANNDSDPTNNVGKDMYGYSGEIAYHFGLGTILGSEWEAVPFYRYTHQNLQTGGLFGIDPNADLGHGDMTFHDVGIAVFPSPSLVLKLNYTKALDKSAGGPMSDKVMGGVGWLW